MIFIMQSPKDLIADVQDSIIFVRKVRNELQIPPKHTLNVYFTDLYLDQALHTYTLKNHHYLMRMANVCVRYKKPLGKSLYIKLLYGELRISYFDLFLALFVYGDKDEEWLKKIIGSFEKKNKFGDIYDFLVNTFDVHYRTY